MDTDDTAFLAVVAIGALFVLALLGYGTLAILGVVGDDAGESAGPSLAGEGTPTEGDAPGTGDTTVTGGGETTEATDGGDDESDGESADDREGTGDDDG